MVKAKRPRKASQSFRIAKKDKRVPRKKANIRDVAPNVTGRKNPVFFDSRNPNHVHGRGNIKFHFDPMKPRVKTEPNNNLGSQTLGNSTTRSVESQTSNMEITDSGAVQRKNNLVSFGTNTPPPPLHVDNSSMTSPPESRSIGTEPPARPLQVESGTQANFVQPQPVLPPFNWSAANPRIVDFAPRPPKKQIALPFSFNWPAATPKTIDFQSKIKNPTGKSNPMIDYNFTGGPIDTRRIADKENVNPRKRRQPPTREAGNRGRRKTATDRPPLAEINRNVPEEPSRNVLETARRIRTLANHPNSINTPEGRRAAKRLQTYVRKHNLTNF